MIRTRKEIKDDINQTQARLDELQDELQDTSAAELVGKTFEYRFDPSITLTVESVDERGYLTVHHTSVLMMSIDYLQGHYEEVVNENN